LLDIFRIQVQAGAVGFDIECRQWGTYPQPKLDIVIKILPV